MKFSKNVFIVLIISLFAVNANAIDYVAYSVDEEGKQSPLPEVIDELPAEEMLNVKWGEYNGNKTRVAVLDVKNESKVSSFTVVGFTGGISIDTVSKGVPVDGIEAILTDIMLHSGRFRMVERKEIDSTIKEQDFGASGRVSKPSAAKIGKILGAEYLIKAVITEYTPDFKGNSFGLGGIGRMVGGKAGGLLGGLGYSSKKSMVAMNFRIIDATTSEVMHSKQVKAVLSDSGLTFGGGGFGSGGALGGFYSTYSKTPIGQALIAAVNKGVFELVKQIGTSQTGAEVVKVSGKKVYLNLGKGTITKGDTLTLFTLGEDLIDPKTGLSLGAEEEEIGQIKVYKVKDKFSIAKTIDADLSEVSAGDKAMLDKPADPLKFGPPRTSDSSSNEGMSAEEADDMF